MRLILDADADILITLSLLCHPAVILLKSSYALSKPNIPPSPIPPDIYLNFYQDFPDLMQFLCNFHLIPTPACLLIDLNIVKRKDICHLAALLSNLTQFSSINIISILNSHGSNTEMCSIYTRFFSTIFVVSNSLLCTISYNNGRLLLTELGAIENRLNTILTA